MLRRKSQWFIATLHLHSTAQAQRLDHPGETVQSPSLTRSSRICVRCSVFATLIPKFVSIPASALPLAFINLIGFVPPVSGVAQEQSFSVKVSQQSCLILPLKKAEWCPLPLHKCHVHPVTDSCLSHNDCSASCMLRSH